MEVTIDLDFLELKHTCWGGAQDTIKRIEEESLGGDLMSFLEDIFSDRLISLTELNDFLWFDRDFIFEHLEIESED